MSQRKFQQHKPLTKNNGDASGAVYRYSWQHFREQAKAIAAHRHSTTAGDVNCDATQIPMIQNMQKTVEILQVDVPVVHANCTSP